VKLSLFGARDQGTFGPGTGWWTSGEPVQGVALPRDSPPNARPRAPPPGLPHASKTPWGPGVRELQLQLSSPSCDNGPPEELTQGLPTGLWSSHPFWVHDLPRCVSLRPHSLPLAGDADGFSYRTLGGGGPAGDADEEGDENDDHDAAGSAVRVPLVRAR
jgi:hypothetical protein